MVPITCLNKSKLYYAWLTIGDNNSTLVAHPWTHRSLDNITLGYIATLVAILVLVVSFTVQHIIGHQCSFVKIR